MRALRLAIGVVFAVALGCTSPTLPLPPPALPSITVGTEPSTFRLSSDRGALPNAVIIVINRDDALSNDQRVDGTIADAQGSWTLSIHGNTGDVVDIFQDSGDARSTPVSATLK